MWLYFTCFLLFFPPSPRGREEGASGCVVCLVVSRVQNTTLSNKGWQHPIAYWKSFLAYTNSPASPGGCLREWFWSHSVWECPLAQFNLLIHDFSAYPLCWIAFICLLNYIIMLNICARTWFLEEEHSFPPLYRDCHGSELAKLLFSKIYPIWD